MSQNCLGQLGLKTIRLKKKFSQHEVAQFLSVHPSLVSMWERGERVPTLAHLALLEELFGETVHLNAPEPASRPPSEQDLWDDLHRLVARVARLEQLLSLTPAEPL